MKETLIDSTAAWTQLPGEVTCSQGWELAQEVTPCHNGGVGCALKRPVLQ